MKISEIFLSIDGEGIRTGYPVVFIRSYGCQLACSYCDSTYAIAGDEFTEMSVDEIVKDIQTKWCWCTRITFTGGEPLLQPDSTDLIKELLAHNYEVNIETNGAVDLSSLLDNKDILKYRTNLIITMDWKSLSSNMSKYMCTDNLSLLKSHDVLKFVVGSVADLNQMKGLINVHDPVCNVFVSPVFNKIEPSQIVQYILDNKLDQVRCQLQIHKIIYPADMRGV